MNVNISIVKAGGCVNPCGMFRRFFIRPGAGQFSGARLAEISSSS